MLSPEHLARLRAERATAERQTKADERYQAVSKGRTKAFESLRCKLPASRRESVNEAPFLLVDCMSFTGDPTTMVSFRGIRPHGDHKEYRSALSCPMIRGPDDMFPMDFQINAYRSELQQAIAVHGSALWNACFDEIQHSVLRMVLIADVIPFKRALDNRMIVGPSPFPIEGLFGRRLG